MAGKLQDRVCLISGSTGIAAATSRLAAQEGARVFFISRTAEDAGALRESIREDGGVCELAVADLTVAAQAEDAVRHCVEVFGRIDALYNVAGISGRRYGDGPLDECTEAGWDTTMTTNVKTMFLLSRAVIRQMLAQPPRENGLRGAILNMASVTAFSPQAQHFATHAYAASKAAVIGLTKAMAAYYAPRKIRVNAIAPGLVRTPMSRRAQSDPDILHFISSKQPLAEDLIEPEAVAKVSVFLLSDDAAMITGETVTVDAGWRVSG